MTSPDTHDSPNAASIDLSNAVDQPPALAMSQIKTGEEHRSEPRFRVRWHVTAWPGENPKAAHHGLIKDISFKGVSILIEHNIKIVNTVTLHIHLPPLAAGQDPHIVEVKSKLVYTIHDSEELSFRAGFHFVQFKSEADRDYLHSRLSNHYIKVGG